MSNNEIPEGFNMTELGSLPDEWGVDRLGDNGYFQYGYTTSATEEDTGTKFLRITDIKEDGVVNWGTVPYGIINDESLQKFRLSEGDVLFARIGATTGKTCIIEGAIPNAVFASYLIRFVPNKELHPKYVFYFTQTREYQKLVDAGKEGKLKKGLSATELKNFIIPLPPLPEQHRIAAVLSAVQDAKEKTGAVIAAAKSLKKSLMRHLFTYGPVPAGAAESAVLVETEIGLVPEGWGVKPLVDIATLQRGKDLPKQNQIPGSYPIVGSSGIIAYHNEYVCVGPGVITGRSGSIGKLTYVEKDYWPHNTGLYVKDFHANNPKFIYYLLHLLDFKKYATGVSVPTLNRNFIHSALLPLPPIPTQQKITNILSTVDKKIEAEENKKKALDELFRSLLHNLMTAKIRVNHLEVVQ